MSDLNQVTLIGNLVRDPEPGSPASGERATRFTLATNFACEDPKSRVRRQVVDFHDVVAHGKLGEIVLAYVKKGSKVYIEGRLRARPRIAKNGQGLAYEIVADNMIMLGHRHAAGDGGGEA